MVGAWEIVVFSFTNGWHFHNKNIKINIKKIKRYLSLLNHRLHFLYFCFPWDFPSVVLFGSLNWPALDGHTDISHDFTQLF